jgi:hypothetical protein
MGIALDFLFLWRGKIDAERVQVFDAIVSCVMACRGNKINHGQPELNAYVALLVEFFTIVF